MAKAKQRPIGEIASDLAEAKQLETRYAESVFELKARLAGEGRKARNHRLIVLGGEIESYVGRPLSEEERHAIASIARAWLRMQTVTGTDGKNAKADADKLLGGIAAIGQADRDAELERARATKEADR